MNWTLEVAAVPVSDVDRAKAFYAEQSASTWTTTSRSSRETASFSSPLTVLAVRSSFARELWRPTCNRVGPQGFAARRITTSARRGLSSRSEEWM